jgi:hypothetical protein
MRCWNDAGRFLPGDIPMRNVILMVSLSVVFIAAIGVYYSPHLMNLGSNPVNASTEAPETTESVKNTQQSEYAIAFLKAQREKEAYARQHLGYFSLAERLPRGKPIAPNKSLDTHSKMRWETLDGDLARLQDERAKLLKAYHEKTQQFFVSSPGEGPMRGFAGPDDILVDNTVYYNEYSQPIQESDPAAFPDSPYESLTRLAPDGEFYDWHNDRLLEFLFPRGFGYVKDRDHVAGFKPHGFRKACHKEISESHYYFAFHIHLVGILRYETPMVYLSDKLPSMEQIHQGKTRPLDYFEKAALMALRDGEDLFIASKDNTLRMLGALRATKTCQQCHEAQIGDLLGAFSYTLRPPGVYAKTRKEE